MCGFYSLELARTICQHAFGLALVRNSWWFRVIGVCIFRPSSLQPRNGAPGSGWMGSFVAFCGGVIAASLIFEDFFSLADLLISHMGPPKRARLTSCVCEFFDVLHRSFQSGRLCPSLRWLFQVHRHILWIGLLCHWQQHWQRRHPWKNWWI